MHTTWDTEHVLPSYAQHATRRATPEVEHSYRLMKNGHPLLMLTMRSGASAAECTPVIRQGQIVTGCVTLDLLEKIQVRAINVQVRFDRKLATVLLCLGFPIPGSFLLSTAFNYETMH